MIALFLVVGEAVLIHLYVCSSLCRDVPIDAVVVKLSSLSESDSAVPDSATIFDQEEANTKSGRNNAGCQKSLPSLGLTHEECFDGTDFCERIPGNSRKFVFLEFRASDIINETDLEKSARVEDISIHHTFVDIESVTDKILLRPGMSVLTLRLSIGIIGKFAVDQVHLVCRSCVLTQAIGDLPPFDQLKQMFTILRSAQVAMHYPSYFDSISRGEVSLSPDLSTDVQLSTESVRTSIIHATLPKKPFFQLDNIFYASINLSVLPLVLLSHPQSEQFDLSNSNGTLSQQSKILTKFNTFSSMLSYFIRLPVINLKLPEEGWFPITWSPIELLPKVQSIRISNHSSVVDTRVFESTALIADSFNILRITIRNTRGIPLRDQPRFTLLDDRDIKQQEICCNDSTIGTSIAVWWQKALIVSVDDSPSLNEACSVKLQQYSDSTIDGTFTMSQASPTSVQHWLILPRFTHSIEFVLPIVHLPMEYQQTLNSTLFCWGIDCPCKFDLRSHRNKQGNLRSAAPPLSSNRVIPNSTTLSPGTPVPSHIPLLQTSFEPIGSRSSVSHRFSTVAKGRQLSMFQSSPSSATSQITLPCPTQLQRVGNPSPGSEKVEYSRPQQPYILIPKQVHTTTATESDDPYEFNSDDRKVCVIVEI